MTMSLKLSDNDTSRFHTKIKTSDKVLLKFTANTWLNNNLKVNIRIDVLSNNPRNNDGILIFMQNYQKKNQ